MDPPDGRPIRIVLVGCSYAGIAALLAFLELRQGKIPRTLLEIPFDPALCRRHSFEVIVVDERDGFFHTVGSPLAHVARPYIRPFWKKFVDFTELKEGGVEFIQGRVTAVKPQTRRLCYASAQSDKSDLWLDYDYLIIATGLQRPWPVAPVEHYFDGYVADAEGLVRRLEKARDPTVVVIGGGAVGTEIAAEIKTHHPTLSVTLVHSHGELLSNEPLPADFKARVLSCMREEGVDVILDQRPDVDVADCRVTFPDGRVLRPGVVLMAAASHPPATQFLPSHAVDERGLVKVHPSLAMADSGGLAGHHFAVGDIAHVSGIKRAGAALRMGAMAAGNVFSGILHASGDTEETKYLEFPHVPPMIALAVGKQAVTYSPDHGVRYGQDVGREVFGEDLGWSMTLKWLGLAHESK